MDYLYDEEGLTATATEFESDLTIDKYDLYWLYEGNTVEAGASILNLCDQEGAELNFYAAYRESYLEDFSFTMYFDMGVYYKWSEHGILNYGTGRIPVNFRIADDQLIVDDSFYKKTATTYAGWWSWYTLYHRIYSTSGAVNVGDKKAKDFQAVITVHSSDFWGYNSASYPFGAAYTSFTITCKDNQITVSPSSTGYLGAYTDYWYDYYYIATGILDIQVNSFQFL